MASGGNEDLLGADCLFFSIVGDRDDGFALGVLHLFHLGGGEDFEPVCFEILAEHDFFSEADPTVLAEKLIGCPLNRSAVQERLRDENIDRYYARLSEEDLISMLI